MGYCQSPLQRGSPPSAHGSVGARSASLRRVRRTVSEFQPDLAVDRVDQHGAAARELAEEDLVDERLLDLR
jgi:hypothetical protein